jgi:hypothetical protein
MPHILLLVFASDSCADASIDRIARPNVFAGELLTPFAKRSPLKAMDCGGAAAQFCGAALTELQR